MHKRHKAPCGNTLSRLPVFPIISPYFKKTFSVRKWDVGFCSRFLFMAWFKDSFCRSIEMDTILGDSLFHFIGSGRELPSFNIKFVATIKKKTCPTGVSVVQLTEGRYIASSRGASWTEVGCKLLYIQFAWPNVTCEKNECYTLWNVVWAANLTQAVKPQCDQPAVELCGYRIEQILPFFHIIFHKESSVSMITLRHYWPVHYHIICTQGNTTAVVFLH